MYNYSRETYLKYDPSYIYYKCIIYLKKRIANVNKIL